MKIRQETLKTLGRRSAALVAALHEESCPIFRLAEVRRLTGLSAASARGLLRNLVHRGVATRLRPGLFVLVPFEHGVDTTYTGNPLLVARKLMEGKDYYLSHGTAMDLHHMVTQPQLVFTVSTPAPRPPVQIFGTDFRFVLCSRPHLFGLVDEWLTKQDKVRVSDLERTVLDGLRRPEYCGGLGEVAKGLWMRQADVNVERLLQYARRLGVGAVCRRLGYLLETYQMATRQVLDELREGFTSTYVLLDPRLPPAGRYLHRWRLRLNLDPEELLTVTRT